MRRPSYQGDLFTTRRPGLIIVLETLGNDVKTVYYRVSYQELKPLILSLADVRVLPWETMEEAGGDKLPGELFLLDAEAWFSLEKGERDRIHRSTLVILHSRDLEQRFIDEIHQKCAWAFAYNPGDPLGREGVLNFQTVMTQAFQIQTMDHRLETYIADAFRDIVDTQILQKQKKQIEELNQKLEELSRTDALTQLLNRRALMEALETEKKRVLRARWRLSKTKEPLRSEPQAENIPSNNTQGMIQDHIGNFACLMVDVDHFKQVNDKYGHLAGDEVLRSFGKLLHEGGIFRDNDVIGRYGGEEFVIILPETNDENALIPAERLREAVKKLEFKDEKGRPFQVSVSIGVAAFLPEKDSADKMIGRADKALYWAKEHGRDKVTRYSPVLDSPTKTKETKGTAGDL